jgi:hypothetical protein
MSARRSLACSSWDSSVKMGSRSAFSAPYSTRAASSPARASSYRCCSRRCCYCCCCCCCRAAAAGGLGCSGLTGVGSHGAADHGGLIAGQCREELAQLVLHGLGDVLVRAHEEPASGHARREPLCTRACGHASQRSRRWRGAGKGAGRGRAASTGAGAARTSGGETLDDGEEVLSDERRRHGVGHGADGLH